MSGESSIESVEQKQLGAAPHSFNPIYSSPAISFRLPIPRFLGLDPLCFGRSSYLSEILFGNAFAFSVVPKTPAAATIPAKLFARVSLLEIRHASVFTLLNANAGRAVVAMIVVANSFMVIITLLCCIVVALLLLALATFAVSHCLSSLLDALLLQEIGNLQALTYCFALDLLCTRPRHSYHHGHKCQCRRTCRVQQHSLCIHVSV